LLDLSLQPGVFLSCTVRFSERLLSLASLLNPLS
jgi:hypothetical protein